MGVPAKNFWNCDKEFAGGLSKLHFTCPEKHFCTKEMDRSIVFLNYSGV